jgi:hypothetical protein
MDIQTEYVLFRGDAHSGAVRGLQHPEQMIDCDGTLRPLSQTSWQKLIWDEVYTAGLAHFAAIVQDAPITVVDGGDLLQGNYHVDDCVSVRMRDQFEIALKTFEPVYKAFPNVVQTYLLIGTRAHALDEEGTVETVMRDRLRAGGHCTELAGHGVFDVGGAVVDVSHVGAMTGKGLTRGNTVMNYIKAMMSEELLVGGNKPPDLYVRFHYHDFNTQQWTMIIQGQAVTSVGAICPPLCSMNGYARGATRSLPFQHVGMLLARIEGGRVDLIPWVKIYDVRQHLSPKPFTVFFKFTHPGRAS